MDTIFQSDSQFYLSVSGVFRRSWKNPQYFTMRSEFIVLIILVIGLYRMKTKELSDKISFYTSRTGR